MQIGPSLENDYEMPIAYLAKKVELRKISLQHVTTYAVERIGNIEKR